MSLFSNSKNTKQCSNLLQHVVLMQLNKQAKDLGDIFNLEQQQFRNNCSIICRPPKGEKISLMISQLRGYFWNTN